MSDITTDVSHKVLLDKMYCPNCKSKSLIIYEQVKGVNILKTNENGELLEAETQFNALKQAFAVTFECRDCGHEFKKRKVDLLSDVLKNIVSN
jgi:rubredoxin